MADAASGPAPEQSTCRHPFTPNRQEARGSARSEATGAILRGALQTLPRRVRGESRSWDAIGVLRPQSPRGTAVAIQRIRIDGPVMSASLPAHHARRARHPVRASGLHESSRPNVSSSMGKA